MSVNYTSPPTGQDRDGYAQWVVQSDSDPTRSYTVTERYDIKAADGTTYLYCSCPSWPRAVATGGCKHTRRVRGDNGRVEMAAVTRPSGLARVAGWCADCNRAFATVTDLNRHVEVEHSPHLGTTVTDLNRHVEVEHSPHLGTAADRAAAKRLLASVLA